MRARRAAAIGLLTLAAFGSSVLPASATEVLVVSRARILSETEAAQMLRLGEQSMRSTLRTWLTAHNRALDAEEAELSRLRGELSPEAFEDRTTEFDRRVRTIRRVAQRREAEIQTALREARNGLLTELYPVLIDILKQRGADVILDADQILIADPSVDMTDEVITAYDERVVPPPLPVFAPLEPAPPEAAPTQPE
ncbi:MAG: OmpH family outer membrane protein [Pseudomonadota bacterium]